MASTITKYDSRTELPRDEKPRRAFNKWLWIVVGAMASQLVFLLWDIHEYPVPFDDEGTYLAQAWAVLNQGELAHYTYWYDHPPLGWLILAPWLWLTGAFDSAGVLTHGRVFMALVAVLNSGLIYVIARRLGIRRVFAVVAVMLFGFSPLALHYHRMVLLDNIAMPLVLGAIALLLSPGRRLWEQQTGVILFGLAVLVKETILLLLPVVAVLLYQGSVRSNRRYSLALGVSFLTSILVLYPLFAALRGELFPGEGHVSLLEAIHWQLVERPTGGAIWDSSSTKYGTIRGWLELDLWFPLLGALAAPLALLLRPLLPLAIGLGTLGIAILRPGHVPVMFIVAALPLLALAIAGLLDFAWSGWTGKHARAKRFDFTLAGRGAVIVLGLPFVLLVFLPAWGSTLRQQLSSDQAEPYARGLQWVIEEIPPGTPILVDGAIWMELVASGYPTDSTVWYFKLDNDPEVAKRFPDGWRDFEYAVSTPVLRATAHDLPNVNEFIGQSSPVASFGQIRAPIGDNTVEIRSIDPIEARSAG